MKTTSLPVFERSFVIFTDVEKFLRDLISLHKSALAGVKNAVNTNYPGQTSFTEKDLEYSVNQALFKRCGEIA
jgi:hypothetical protein